jgi:hypothetical protein
MENVLEREYVAPVPQFELGNLLNGGIILQVGSVPPLRNVYLI